MARTQHEVEEARTILHQQSNDVVRADALRAEPAGRGSGPIHLYEREVFDQTLEMCLTNTWLCMKYEIPAIQAAGGGAIVNISSDAGRVGSSGESVYSACKGGMIAFSKTLAREYTRNRIRVNTVCPGPTDTPLFAAVSIDPEVGEKIHQGLKRAIPMKRLGVPEDYAGMVAFLASDDAGYITGQTIRVSGGLTMHG